MFIAHRVEGLRRITKERLENLGYHSLGDAKTPA